MAYVAARRRIHRYLPRAAPFLDRLTAYYRKFGQISYEGLTNQQHRRNNLIAASHVGIENAGLTKSFVDLGDISKARQHKKLVYLYYNLMDNAEKARRLVTGHDMSKVPRYIQMVIMAELVRALVERPEGAAIKLARDTLLAHQWVSFIRLDDEKTGSLIASKVQSAQGRVLIPYGNLHFTPVGIQTYVDDPLIIEIFANRADCAAKEVMENHTDVFLDVFRTPRYFGSHVLCLQDGSVIERPAVATPQNVINSEREDWQRQIIAARQKSLYFDRSIATGPQTGVAPKPFFAASTQSKPKLTERLGSPHPSGVQPTAGHHSDFISSECKAEVVPESPSWAILRGYNEAPHNAPEQRITTAPRRPSLLSRLVTKRQP